MSASANDVASNSQDTNDQKNMESTSIGDGETDGLDTLVDDDPELCEHSEADWLDTHYGDARSVTVQFGADEKVYSFPEKVLTSNFHFFRAALQRNESGPVFTEGKAQHVHVQNITPLAFARLFKWVQTASESFSDCDKIVHLLQAVIAADYLGLSSDQFDEFEEYASHRLALVLLHDRRKLTPSHLKVVATHSAFSSKVIWKRFVKAGVRPFLQQFMLDHPKPVLSSSATDGWAEGSSERADMTTPVSVQDSWTGWVPPMRRPQPGNEDMATWVSILDHCRQVREGNKDYALDVMKEVGDTLGNGRAKHDSWAHEYGRGPVDYNDPLISGLPLDFCHIYKGMDFTAYIDSMI